MPKVRPKKKKVRKTERQTDREIERKKEKGRKKGKEGGRERKEGRKEGAGENKRLEPWSGAAVVRRGSHRTQRLFYHPNVTCSPQNQTDRATGAAPWP